MFRYILFSVFTVIHVYVFWRAASVPYWRRPVSRKVLIGVGVLLWAGFFLGLFAVHGGSGTLAEVMEFCGMTWVGVLFLLFVAVLAVDVITGFGFLFSRFAPSLRGWALTAGMVLSVIALIQGFRPPVVQHYEVAIPGLPHEMDGTVIVAMGDLHVGALLGERWLADRVTQVKAERPDIVFLLGDIFEGHGKSMDELLPVLRGFAAPLGVWVVLGNHEFYGRLSSSISLIEKAGFRLLRDRWVEVRPGFVVAGVDDLTTSRRAGRSDDQIGKALANHPPGATILLSHTPWQVERAAHAGVDLMLSGHTHSGQIWPFGYLVRLFYPLLEGRFEISGMTIIVTRGTGMWGPRMRLWRRGEILRVTLHGTKG